MLYIKQTANSLGLFEIEKSMDVNINKTNKSRKPLSAIVNRLDEQVSIPESYIIRSITPLSKFQFNKVLLTYPDIILVIEVF